MCVGIGALCIAFVAVAPPEGGLESNSASISATIGEGPGHPIEEERWRERETEKEITSMIANKKHTHTRMQASLMNSVGD